MIRNKPIGIFDSGVGGFNLAREIFHKLPNEQIIYYGNTAPDNDGDGIKTDEESLVISRKIVNFLINEGVKLVVIASDVDSIVCIGRLQKEFNIPVIGVVEPYIKIMDEVLYGLKSNDLFREIVDKPKHKFICDEDMLSFIKGYNIAFKE